MQIFPDRAKYSQIAAKIVRVGNSIVKVRTLRYAKPLSNAVIHGIPTGSWQDAATANVGGVIFFK